jgi:hypothetical protein
MRHHEDRNLLKTRIRESHPQQSIPCAVRRASKIKLLANYWLLHRKLKHRCPIQPQQSKLESDAVDGVSG